MKKIFFGLLCLLPLLVCAGTGNDTLKFWVEFKDKAGTRFSTERPQEFLSARAIERRKKFDIKITEEDFPVNPWYVSDVAAKGAKVLTTSRWLNGVTVQTANPGIMKELLALPFVKSVTKVGIYSSKDNTKLEYLMEFFMSIGGEAEDGKKEDASPDKKYYGMAYNQTEMLNGIAMHKLGYNGRGVVIAVLDGGFMNVDKIKTFNHLFENEQILGTWDFVKQDSNVFDDNNHGMNVLSCMAAKTEGSMVGTAPEASYWLLRTEDANTEYMIEEANWASGAEFADSAGADIINSSLGYTEFDDEDMNHKYADLNGKKSISTRAATIAAQKGILICNAAGNEGDGDWKFVGAPADADGIFTVGGVNPDSTHADFSSYGPTADGRIKPDVVAQASDVVVASVSDGFYGSQGTSFASPVLCGMVACLVQANPQKTPKQIMDAIKLSASQYNNPDTVLGYGIPDFIKANRYLGNDKSFDYKKNQVETAPAATITDKAVVTLYAAKKQKITATLRNSTGIAITTREVEPDGTAGRFHKMAFSLENEKAGTYTIDITIGTSNFSYRVTKE